MMRRVLALALALAAAGATAADAMFNLVDDSRRVERITHDTGMVVEIGAVVDQPFMVEFSSGEQVSDVAGGTIAQWDVHKKGHRLFILARKESRYTTLLVTTKEHSYVFDLVPRTATPANLAQRRSKIVVSDPAPPAPPPALPLEPYRNASYSMQVVSSSAEIRPDEVYDDGRFTWFHFPHGTEIPAIYSSVPGSREEMLVNRHVDGDYIVMQAVAPSWNLRLGGALVGIFNERPGGAATGPRNGTTVPGLVRESKP